MSTRASLLSRRVFVDSSAYLGIADRRDHTHHVARAIISRVASERLHLFTTNFVVAEAHALLPARLGRAAAVEFLSDVDQGTTTVVRVSLRDERRAREIIAQYDDKDFTLTDATSFTVMERLRITYAFTFDHHFTQYGFIALTAGQE
jgi:uncharacterized protein